MVLNISKDRDSTTSLSILFQCLTTLRLTVFFCATAQRPLNSPCFPPWLPALVSRPFRATWSGWFLRKGVSIVPMKLSCALIYVHTILCGHPSSRGLSTHGTLQSSLHHYLPFTTVFQLYLPSCSASWWG